LNKQLSRSDNFTRVDNHKVSAVALLKSANHHRLIISYSENTKLECNDSPFFFNSNCQQN